VGDPVKPTGLFCGRRRLVEDPKAVLDGLEKILRNHVDEGGPGASGSSGGALT
jgi:hypothetical protein